MARRGMSSILGTIIFVALLFTTIVPMQLVMKQADVLFEQKKLELGRNDEEHARETINVYAYPTGDIAPDNLTVKVDNLCEMNVEVIRVWINDTIHTQQNVIHSMNTQVIGSYDVDPHNGSSFDIRVTTERGNVFEASSGAIIHDGMGWEVDEKFINVLISSQGVVFKVYVTGPNNYSDYAQVWKIGGTAFKAFDITTSGNGEYHVIVKKGSNTIHEETILMEWPDGPSVLWVYA